MFLRKFHTTAYQKPKPEEMENITNSNYTYVIGDLISTNLAAPKTNNLCANVRARARGLGASMCWRREAGTGLSVGEHGRQ